MEPERVIEREVRIMRDCVKIETERLSPRLCV
jgi:hypothetical protein